MFNRIESIIRVKRRCTLKVGKFDVDRKRGVLEYGKRSDEQRGSVKIADDDLQNHAFLSGHKFL